MVDQEVIDSILARLDALETILSSEIEPELVGIKSVLTSVRSDITTIAAKIIKAITGGSDVVI